MALTQLLILSRYADGAGTLLSVSLDQQACQLQDWHVMFVSQSFHAHEQAW